MPTTSVPVTPIHCALCRSAVVEAVEQAGAHVLAASIGGGEVVVDTDDAAVLAQVATAVARISHGH